jgi:hypothetical protein
MANQRLACNPNLSRTGRRPGQRNRALPDRAEDSGNVFSAKRWCLGAEKSRSWLYNRWKNGGGPRFVKVGSDRVILESPQEYFRRVAKEQERARAAQERAA